MMFNRRTTAALLTIYLTMGSIACHAGDDTAKEARPPVDAARSAAAVDALKAKTMKQLIKVPGGTFIMGDFGPLHNEEKMPYSPRLDDDVLRKVTLDGFQLQAWKVTYADFDVYTDAVRLPPVAQDEMDMDYRYLPDIAAGVSWPQALAYCEWIGKQISTPMTLPTEAQWEYAARAGGKMLVYATDNGEMEDGRNVSSIAQYDAFAEKHGKQTWTSSLGNFPPNPLGLYDMADHGREWVSDWYAPEYDLQQINNPVGPSSGTEKVLRASTDNAADQLTFTSMTFTRHHKVPEPGPLTFADGEAIEANPNPNQGNSFRCAAKLR